MDVMETRATEIASYQGQAQDALGSTTGANSGASLVWGLTDATRINERFDLVAANNLQKNKEIYEQKIKDRNALFEGMSTGKIDLQRMLPGDRDQVKNRYLAPMREMLLENPDLKSDPEKYVQFQKLAQDFDEAKTYAQHRTKLIEDMDSEIAKELDPEKKKRMEEHRNKSLAQGLFDEVKPYQQSLDWDDTIYPKGNEVTTTNKALDKENLVTTTTVRTDPQTFVHDVYQNYIESANIALKNKMDEYANNFAALDPRSKARVVDGWNKKIAEINALEKYVPNDGKYIEPINAKVTNNPDGTISVEVKETNPRIVLAEALAKGYKNTTTKTSEPSKLASEIAENRQTIAKMARDMKSANAEDALKYAQAKQALANADKINQDRRDAEIAGKKDPAKSQADFNINQTLAVFDPNKYNGMSRLPDLKGKDGKPVPGGRVIKAPDGKGGSMSALSDDQEKLFGRVVPTAQGPIVEKPDKIIYMDQNKKDPYFVAVFEQRQAYDDKGNPRTTKEGKPIYSSAAADQKQTMIIRPHRLFTRQIKGVIGETAAGTESKEFNTATDRYFERAGSQNMDVSLLSLLDAPEWQAPQQGAATSAPTAPPSGATTTLPPEQETKFKGWLQQTGREETQDYDYRAYYKATGGKAKEGAHLPDDYKMPNHITFSTDSKYSTKETPGGTWKKNKRGIWEYTPSTYVLSQHSPEELKTYFDENEKGAILNLPSATKELIDKKKSLFK